MTGIIITLLVVAILGLLVVFLYQRVNNRGVTPA